MDDLQRAYEAATGAYYGERDGEAFASAEEAMPVAMAALFASLYGCEQCGGLGQTRTWDPMNTVEIVEDCPADHAVIEMLGQTIHADKDKCEWLCDNAGVFASGLFDDSIACTPDTLPPGDEEEHDSCGWQPRMELLKGST